MDGYKWMKGPWEALSTYHKLVYVSDVLLWILQHSDEERRRNTTKYRLWQSIVRASKPFIKTHNDAIELDAYYRLVRDNYWFEQDYEQAKAGTFQPFWEKHK
jgi:hypothetical protein